MYTHWSVYFPLMPRDGSLTRARIIDAASRLFYAGGVREVGVDAVAAKAGITKRTLYAHFRSKDDLVAAYLEGRDQPNLERLAAWYAAAAGGPSDKVRAIFAGLAQAARHPKWQGCGFLRTTAELASMPGHPAIRIGRAHKKRFEAWLGERLADAGIADPPALARQVVLLLDGAFATMLLHRDPAYAEAAGEAAATLVRQAEKPCGGS